MFLRRGSLFVLGCFLVLICLSGRGLAAERGRCSPEGIELVDGGGIADEDAKHVAIRYAGKEIAVKWGTKLVSTKRVHDAKGNSYLFIILTEGGSCGDGALLVTASNGRLVTYDFGGGPCGEWEFIEANKIVFHTVWMDICGLDWCHACGPSYPIMWSIDDCRNGTIIARRYKDLREVYSDPDGKVHVKNMLMDLRQQIIRRAADEETIPAFSGPLEKEFCTKVAEGDEGQRTFELLFSADFSIGDRFYFFKDR